MASPQRSHAPPRQISFIAIIIFILASGFYLYEFILQVSPSVMTHALMRDFNVSAAGLGLLAASYFYAYAPMQIPAGILYDHFGPRRLISLALVLCAAGTYFFSITESLAIASFGRFFMGIGSAFSFIGVLVLISRWFPSRYYAFLVGITQLMSSIGAIVGGAPLALLVNQIGWRDSLLYVAIAGIVLALLVWLIVRDRPPSATAEADFKHEKQRFAQVCRNRQTWFVALYAFAVWAPITVIAALWGVPFLMRLYSISNADAAGMIAIIWVAIGISCPLFGAASDWFGRRCLPMAVCALLGLLSSLSLLYIPHISQSWCAVCLFGIGMAAAGQTISFAVVKDLNKPQLIGTASGINNMATVAGGALLQPLVGYLLTRFWSGQLHNNLPLYQIADYQKALLVIPLCYVLAFIMSAGFITETYCKDQT